MHLRFNNQTWWQSDEKPLIGKHVSGLFTTYHTIKNGFNQDSTDQLNVNNALIIAMYKFSGGAGSAPAGTYILTDTDTSKWLLLTGSETISGGYKRLLSHLYQGIKAFTARLVVNC